MARSDDEKKEPPKIPSADERPRDLGRPDAADELREKAQQKLQRDSAPDRLSRDGGFHRLQGKMPEDPIADRAREDLLDKKLAALRQENGWERAAWERSSVSERWATIQRTENNLATIERRAALLVTPMSPMDLEEAARKGDFAYGRLTMRNGNPVALYLNPKLILESEPDRALQTYLHEEHHIEQMLAIIDPDSRPDASTSDARAWSDSIGKLYYKAMKGGAPSDAEYRTYAHEVSARYNSARLYMRYL